MLWRLSCCDQSNVASTSGSDLSGRAFGFELPPEPMNDRSPSPELIKKRQGKSLRQLVLAELVVERADRNIEQASRLLAVAVHRLQGVDDERSLERAKRVAQRAAQRNGHLRLRRAAAVKLSTHVVFFHGIASRGQHHQTLKKVL